MKTLRRVAPKTTVKEDIISFISSNEDNLKFIAEFKGYLVAALKKEFKVLHENNNNVFMPRQEIINEPHPLVLILQYNNFAPKEELHHWHQLGSLHLFIRRLEDCEKIFKI
jgi:hypothetical protein